MLHVAYEQRSTGADGRVEMIEGRLVRLESREIRPVRMKSLFRCGVQR